MELTLPVPRTTTHPTAWTSRAAACPSRTGCALSADPLSQRSPYPATAPLTRQVETLCQILGQPRFRNSFLPIHMLAALIQCMHACEDAGRGFKICSTLAGLPIEDAEVPHELGQELALRMHAAMVRLQTMDVIFYEAQRQVSSLPAVPIVP